MKLLYTLAAILAVALAVEDKYTGYEDSEAVATTANKLVVAREGNDLIAAAYSYPQWQAPNNWQNNNPVNSWTNQAGNWGNPTNTWTNPPNFVKPSNTWGNQVNEVQNDYYWSSTNAPAITTTTTPVPVIKNDHYIGDNGDYKYEYQIGNGIHVGEQGCFTNPDHDEESLVKKGWYSYVGGDGKTYTVTYWADKTGFHAFGEHLPTAPPVPAAIQAALDKQKEDEKNKPLQDYPSQTPAPVQVYPTQPTPIYTQQPVGPSNQNYKPVYNPQQQYYPSQSTNYPQQQYPQQQYPQQQYPQQQYPQQQYPQQQYPQQQYPQQQYQQQYQQQNYGSKYNV